MTAAIRTPESPIADREHGAGLIATAITSVAVLGIVLLPTHVLLALQRRSAVGAVAFDTARRVALAGDPIDRADAEARARTLLGDPSATLDWTTTDQQVSLRIVTRAASLLPGIGPLRSLTRIDRTVTVRSERLR